jgi:hypothetical protein
MTITSTLPLFSMDGEAPRTTRVYFGLGACGERVKIGLTKRKYGHRGGEMWFIELCSVPDADRTTEAAYHEKYAKERIDRTEWFRLSDRLCMDLIAMCLAQQCTQSYEILKGVLYARLRQRKTAA